jgi:hypothetical protein
MIDFIIQENSVLTRSRDLSRPNVSCFTYNLSVGVYPNAILFICDADRDYRDSCRLEFTAPNPFADPTTYEAPKKRFIIPRSKVVHAGTGSSEMS